MEEMFSLIKKEYHLFYNSFLKEGKLPLKDTGKGFWGAAVSDEVFEAFKKIGLNRFSNFLDIGSGDGKVVLIASLFCKNAIGIEIDEELFLKSIEIKRKLNRNNTMFINKDFYEHDFSRYDVMFLNPDQPLSRGLESKLLSEMKGKLILYGHHFHPKLLKRDQSFALDGTFISVYSR